MTPKYDFIAIDYIRNERVAVGQLLIIITFICLIILIISILKFGVPCAIYVPTPIKIARRALSLAGLKPHEILYDLGCGDGRVLILATIEYGAFAVGVECNPLLAWIARRNVRRANVEEFVKVITGNLFNINLHKADVVFLYLSQYANERLKDKMAKELKHGARVVTYIFPIVGWKPLVKDEKQNIYVYEIPYSLSDEKGNINPK